MTKLKSQSAVFTGAAVGPSSDEVKVFAWKGDVADPDYVRVVVDGVVSELGGVDILINNAGARVGEPVSIDEPPPLDNGLRGDP